MGNFDKKFESVNQTWTTPLAMFNEMNEEFNFTLDAAASAENALVQKYYTKEDNALVCSWENEVVWLNPPYGEKGQGKLSDWVKKSYIESLNGATVVMLIPARTNTVWFHDYCLAHAEVRFIKGRPKFGDAKYGLPQPLCYVIFKGKKYNE